MTDSEKDTLVHIEKVQTNLGRAIGNLVTRAIAHDASKLVEPELSGYEGLTQALKGLAYGTPEHRAAFAPFKEIIQHHYEHNAHHPERWVNGVDDMSLLDILEMLADWKAANDRNGGDFYKSIDVSVRSFGIDEQLASILTNTAKELGWLP
jgi:hypothetical protein